MQQVLSSVLQQASNPAGMGSSTGVDQQDSDHRREGTLGDGLRTG
jgi:hypothetical protein